MRCGDSNRLADEQAIVWLEDASQLPYVRETVAYCAHRAARPGRGRLPQDDTGQCRLVAYSTLRRQASSRGGSFERRIFWLKSYDPYLDGGCPAEAVDPATVKPRRPAARTSKCSVRGYELQLLLSAERILRQPGRPAMARAPADPSPCLFAAARAAAGLERAANELLPLVERAGELPIAVAMDLVLVLDRLIHLLGGLRGLAIAGGDAGSGPVDRELYALIRRIRGPLDRLTRPDSQSPNGQGAVG